MHPSRSSARACNICGAACAAATPRLRRACWPCAARVISSLAVSFRFGGRTDNEALYEIIDGQRVELRPMSAYATIVSSRLLQKLGSFAAAKSLAEVVGETLFRLPLK